MPRQSFTEIREAYLYWPNIIGGDRPTLDKARMLLLAKNYRQAVAKLREIISLSAKRADLESLGAGFLICGLVMFYAKDYRTASQYLIEVVCWITIPRGVEKCGGCDARLWIEAGGISSPWAVFPRPRDARTLAEMFQKAARPRLVA